MYTLSRDAKGSLSLLCEAETKTGIVRETPAGPFDIGNASKETQSLALAILIHYFGADAGGIAEAEHKAESFLGAFLLTLTIPFGGQLELSSEILDRWVFLTQIPQRGK